MTEIASPQAVLDFWRAAGPGKWYKKDAAFDADIRERFLATYERAAAGELRAWERTAEGALALAIVLDQFPRNMFRDDPRAFAADAEARKVTAHAIDSGFDRMIEPPLRQFIYMPLMHSERLSDQDRCVDLFRQDGSAENLKFAQIHADIIRRFGRFPHRNKVLGRPTSADEQAFLDSGGFSG